MARKTTNTAQVQEAEVISEVLAAAPPAPQVANVIDNENILQSHSLVRNGIIYPNPRSVIMPVIEILNTAQEIRVTGENALEIDNNGSKQIAFQRFNVIGNFAVDEEYSYEVGMLAALDLSVPKVKVYTGASIRACLNLSLFGHDNVTKFDISNAGTIDLIRLHLQDIGNKIARTREVINRLKSIRMDAVSVQQALGKILMENNTTRNAFGSTNVLKGTELLANPDSKYYHAQEGFNAWLFYNAFTENLKKSTVFDMADKSADFFRLAGTALPQLN